MHEPLRISSAYCEDVIDCYLRAQDPSRTLQEQEGHDLEVGEFGGDNIAILLCACVLFSVEKVSPLLGATNWIWVSIVQ